MNRDLIFPLCVAAGVLGVLLHGQAPPPPPAPLPTGAPHINPSQLGDLPELFVAPVGMTDVQVMGNAQGNPGLYICNGYANFQPANGTAQGVPLYSELIIPAHMETSGPVGDSKWVCLDGPAGVNANEWVLEAQAP